MQMIYISLHQGKWELGKKLESPFSSPYRWLGPALLLPPPTNPNYYSSPCIKLLFKATLGLFPPKNKQDPEDGDARSCRTLRSSRRSRRTWGFILSLTISINFFFFFLLLPSRPQKINSPTSAWDTIQPDTETPSPPSVSPFSGSHLEHRVFPPSPGAPGGLGGVQAGGTSPPPPLFLISLGEVAISGDLGFFQLFFLLFSAGCFFFFPVLESPWWLRGGVLVAPWPLFGGAWEGPSSSCCCWGPAQLSLRRNSKGEFSCPGQA